MDIEKAYRLISEKLSLWLRELVRLLPNILLAALVLTIGIVLSKLARNLTRKFFMRLGHATTLTSLFASLIINRYQLY